MGGMRTCPVLSMQDIWMCGILFFSGQTRNVLNLRVDGYLSNYPDNAEVLLKRTASGMPIFLRTGNTHTGLPQSLIIHLTHSSQWKDMCSLT